MSPSRPLPPSGRRRAARGSPPVPRRVRPWRSRCSRPTSPSHWRNRVRRPRPARPRRRSTSVSPATTYRAWASATTARTGWHGDALFGTTARTARSAWIGEVWEAAPTLGGAVPRSRTSGSPKAGGADAGGSGNSSSPPTRNESHDRKITLGGGFESPEGWFAAGYAATAITGRRQTDVTTSTSIAQTVFGARRRQARSSSKITTTPDHPAALERAWDYGVGLPRRPTSTRGPLLRLHRRRRLRVGRRAMRARRL